MFFTKKQPSEESRFDMYPFHWFCPVKGVHINEWRFSKYAQNLYRSNKKQFRDKIRSFDNADELLKASRNYIEEAAIHKNYES